METGIWAVSVGSKAVDRFAQLLDPENSTKDLGPVIYEDFASCSKFCHDILYTCLEREEQDGIFCTMDTTILLFVIIAAVLTGVLIPIACVAICMCTRFCGIFDDSHMETQGLIHSDIKQDWDTYPSSECHQQTHCNQEELVECPIGVTPLLSKIENPPLKLDDNPYKETVITTNINEI